MPIFFSVHFDRDLWGPDNSYVFLPDEHLEVNLNIREQLTIGSEEVWVKLVKRNI